MSFPVGIGSLGGAVFPGGTLNHSANYVISIMAYWYRCPNYGTPKGEIYISDIFFFMLLPKFRTKKNLLSSKEISLSLSYFKPF